MIDEDRNIAYMSLDELIESLLEAKEHCVDGRSKVYVKRGLVHDPAYIIGVEYNFQNVTIKYE